MRTPAENTVDPQIASELEQLEGEFGPDLVALRAEPDQQFAADLDARAAEGFPGSEGRIERLRSRFAGSGRRRVLLPALAGATTVILVATVVVASNQGGEGTAPLSHVDTTTPETSRLGEAATKPEAAAGAAATATGTATSNAPLAPVTGRRRQIERSAEMTLGTDPEHVQDVSGRVFDIVRRFDGIVLSSSVRDGSDGDAGASFQLLFPSPHLGDALGDLSGIAEVRSRNESTLDITKPFVSVREHLRDARAEAAGLLKQLAGADSQAERESIEAQLSQVRSRIAHLRSASQRLQRRSDF
jgi:hypothetical protein